MSVPIWYSRCELLGVRQGVPGLAREAHVLKQAAWADAVLRLLGQDPLPSGKRRHRPAAAAMAPGWMKVEMNLKLSLIRSAVEGQLTCSKLWTQVTLPQVIDTDAVLRPRAGPSPRRQTAAPAYGGSNGTGLAIRTGSMFSVEHVQRLMESKCSKLETGDSSPLVIDTISVCLNEKCRPASEVTSLLKAG